MVAETKDRPVATTVSRRTGDGYHCDTIDDCPATAIIPVDVYCDFDGAICPVDDILGGPDWFNDYVNGHPEVALGRLGHSLDAYTIDRRCAGNVRWSSKLIDNINELIDGGWVQWHWLTSNQLWMDSFDREIGIDHSKVQVETLVERDYQIVPGGKVGVMRRAVVKLGECEHSGRTVCPVVVWIDDDILGKEEAALLDDLARRSGVQLLKFTPMASVGLTKSDMLALTLAVIGPFGDESGPYLRGDWQTICYLNNRFRLGDDE